MRIFHSQGDESMLLDSRAGLVALHSELLAFLSSPQNEHAVAAEQTGNPAPYHEFLLGLRVRKSEAEIVLALASDGWLELSGSQENLARYISHFYFEPGQESGHHHPEHVDMPGYMHPSSLKLIIEADSTWGE